MSRHWLLALLVFAACDAPDDDEESDETVADRVNAPRLVKKDIVLGTGKEAHSGDSITAHYILWLEDGTKVQSSLESGRPFTATLAPGRMIDGWLYGIPGMKVGGKRRLEVPSHMAYGASGRAPIPPHADLIFEVHLLRVN